MFILIFVLPEGWVKPMLVLQTPMLISFLNQVVKSFPRRARHACRASGEEWVAGKQDAREFQSEEEYLNSLELQGWRKIYGKFRPPNF